MFPNIRWPIIAFYIVLFLCPLVPACACVEDFLALSLNEEALPA